MVNKGLLSYQHSMNVIALLYDYHWTFDLMMNVKQELQYAVDHMTEHLVYEKCACGDTEKDLNFYRELLVELENVIERGNFSAVPWIQEKMHEFVVAKPPQHRCIGRLLDDPSYDWIRDAKL